MVEPSIRLRGELSRCRRWSTFLPAFIAVTGLAAGCAGAQSRAPNVEAVSFTSRPVRGAITLAGDAETDAVLVHAVGTHYFGRVDGTASSAHDLRTAAVRLRNRVVEFAADILSNFVSSVRYRTYSVDADPCPPAN